MKLFLSLSFILALIGMSGCQNSGESFNPPVTGSAEAQQITLPKEQLTPVSGAIFSKMYGEYKIISCDDRSKNDSDGLKACEYSGAAVYQSAQGSNSTSIMLKRQAGDEVKFALFSYEASFNSAITKYREDDRSASYSTYFSGSTNTFSSETKFELLSANQIRMTLKNSSWLESQTAHNFDYEFEFILEK